MVGNGGHSDKQTSFMKYHFRYIQTLKLLSKLNTFKNSQYHCVQIWQKRREKLLKLKLCIFVLSRVHLECTNMILVKSDPTKVIKAKLKALRLPKSRLCTIIFVFYAAFESVCIELQSLWDLSWLKVLKAKKATRNIQN